MKVRCAKCVVEYEFEVGSPVEEGVRVECGTCGHRFRLFEDGARDTEWRVRSPNGTCETFYELTTLKRHIVENKFDREAELSRRGEPWVRLSEAPGFSTLFGIAGNAGGASGEVDVEARLGVPRGGRGSRVGAVLRFGATLCLGGALVLGGLFFSESPYGAAFLQSSAKEAVVTAPSPAGVEVVKAVASPAPVEAVKAVASPAPVEVVKAVAPPAGVEVVKAVVVEKAPVVAEASVAPKRAPASEALLPRKAAASPAKRGGVPSLLRLMNRAQLFREQDRPLRSLEVYREVLGRDEGNLEAEVGVGWCLFDLRRYGESREVFDAVIVRSPRLSDAHIGLAEIHRIEGRAELARKHFNEYLRIEPRGEGVAMVRAMLKDLK